MAAGSRGRIMYEKKVQAPPPSKDFHRVSVTDKCVTFTTWKVSMRRDQYGKPPTSYRLTYDDFRCDTMISAWIGSYFGHDVLLYVRGLVHGDWLLQMKNTILLRIFSYLDLADIYRLSQVCRQLHTICNNNNLWKNLYEKRCGEVGMRVRELGETRGWKKMFFNDNLHVRRKTSASGKAKSINSETSLE